MRPNRAVLLALAALFGALALIGCSDDDGRISVVVYSPHGEEILDRFEALFEAAHPEVDVRCFPLTSQECLTRLRAAKANPDCDVFWGATASLHRQAARSDLLLPYQPAWADQVDPRFATGDDRFHAQFVMLQVLMYNDLTMAPEDAPRGFEDLVTPAWKDRIVIRLPPASGTMRGIFSWLISWQARLHGGDIEKGFDYLRALHANTKSYATDPNGMFEAIKRDPKNVVSIWNFTDAKFQKATYGTPLGVKIPEEGVPVVVDCIALVKKKDGEDPRRAAATRAFFDYVTSIEASEILARHHFRIPTRNDLPDSAKPDWLRDLTFEPLPADGQAASEHADEWMTFWDENIKSLPR